MYPHWLFVLKTGWWARLEKAASRAGRMARGAMNMEGELEADEL
jgi:hypothetical protein